MVTFFQIMNWFIVFGIVVMVVEAAIKGELGPEKPLFPPEEESQEVKDGIRKYFGC